ncbi:MAG: hypothetical protein D6815_00700, partial [Candidatus Dadabacteria bacterium]
MTNDKEERTVERATSRRELLKSAAFLGGCGLLAGRIAGVFGRLAHAKHLEALDRGTYDYH